jgi:uncharacterized protein YndB with AHSA1/START domain
MRSKSYEINVGQAEKFARRLTIRASRQRVFDAIGTIDGPRHWWTTIVNGSAAVGERLCFGSTGLDEQIVMRVDAGATSGKERNCTFGSVSAGQR